MSLQVNFTTHGHDLKAAYDAILKPTDPKNGDNWAIFGYDKGTNDLKVLGQGDGGLEELEDEFADGKIQYAFARIVDPYSQLNKFVLIGWCGDGVPESKKGLFNSHLADVSQFLKGYHLQINARSEADVSPAQIMKRVEEGSGSKYSVHKEIYEAERIRPLQSAYKRTEIPDIAALQRNPTKPEPAPKYSMGTSRTFGSPAPSTPPTTKPEERTWNSPVSSSSNYSSPPTSKPVERTWKTSGSSSYTGSTGASFNKVAPPSSLSSYGQTTPNEPTMNKAQQMRLERETREKEERVRIEKEIRDREAREAQASDRSGEQKQAEERRLQEQREREQEEQRAQDRAREERAAREREERERAEAESAARSAREAAKAREEELARDQAAKEEDQKRQQEQQQRQREREAKEAADRARREQAEEERQRQEAEAEEERMAQEEAQRRLHEEEEEERRLQEEVSAATAHDDVHTSSSGDLAPVSVSAVVLYSYDKAEENEMTLYEGEVIVNVTELDVGWWSGESRDGTRSGLFPANYVEVIESAEQEAPVAAHEDQTYAYDAHEAQVSQEPEVVAVNGAASDKPSAVALYDYSAGETNEISFAEGDVLVNIEFVSDDWWSGYSQDHTRAGLFPANYVELHQ